MSALKLTIGGATNPYKWVRAITFPPPSSSSSSSFFCLSFRRTILPCAPSAHVNIAPFGFCGFRLSRVRDLRCFSSAEKGGFVDDMGPMSSPEQNGWSQNGLRRSNQPSVPPPSLKMTEPKEDQQSKFLTLPTVLTLGRVAAVPLLICTFYMDSWWATTATTGIFIVAAITDWLDGYLARKMKLGSAFGAFLDPVADKLMVAATLVLLCTKPMQVAMFGDIPWLLPVPSIAIIGREITMSAVREWAASQNAKLLEAVAVNNLGKWKTASQMIALTILLATRDSSLGGPGSLLASGVVLLYISAGLSLWSLAVYMGKISKVLLK